MAVKLIRKNNSDAITAAMDAAMYFMMLGEGIFNRVYNSCTASITNDLLTIDSGIILLGGRIIEIPENSSVKLSLDSYGKTVTIYVKANITIEEDDSQSKATIYLSTESTQSERHALIKAGVYTTNLFVIKYVHSMAAYTIYPVVGYMEAGVAKNATNLGTDGRIGGTKVSQLFVIGSDGNVSMVAKTKEAKEAEIAEGLAYVDDGDGNNLNKVTEDLYMPYRGVYLAVDSILTGEYKISAQSIKEANTSVEIEHDPASITIPFDIGASLKNTHMSCIAIRLNIGDAPQWINGNYAEKDDSFFVDDAQVKIMNKNNPITSESEYKDVKSKSNTTLAHTIIRFFKKPTKDFTFSLHVLSFGGEAV